MLLVATAACGDASPEPAAEGALPALELTGVSWVEHAGERVRQRARAARILLAPAAFGPFEVSLVDEILLAGLHLDLFLDAGAAAGAPGDPLDDPWLGALRVTSLRGGLPAGGARLVDASWTVWRGGVPIARLFARQARVRHRAAPLELLDVRLELLGQERVVSASRATWEPRSRTFALRGGYALQVQGLRSEGERGRVPLEEAPDIDAGSAGQARRDSR